MTDVVTAPVRTGYSSVLRLRGMPALYTAHTVSMIGTVAAEVALSILVFQRTGSALLSALVLVCSFLPYAVAGTVLSSIADRYPARPVLVGCDLISAACVAVMLVPGIPVPALLGLLLLTGTVAPLFQGARTSSLVHLLDRDLFPVGRSMLRAISQSAVLIGFAAGGVAVATVGPRWMLVADVLSFVASSALIRFGTPFTPANSVAEDRSTRAVLADSVIGLRYLRGQPALRRLILLSWAAPAFGVAADGLAVAYTAQAGSAATAAGALFTGLAAGMVFGEIAVARLTPDRRRRLVLPLLLLNQVPPIAFLLVPGVPLAAGLLVVAGAGFAFEQGIDPLILDATEPTMRGRVFTVQGSGLMTVQGLGIAAAGVAGVILRPSIVIGAAGILGTVATVVLARRALHAVDGRAA